MPNSLGATYIVIDNAFIQHTFYSLKDAYAFIKDKGYDNWKVLRRETIEQVVASSEEQNEY